jgi:hypothetical protein
MPYARRYETFEVRRLLQEAEGTGSPLTGAGAHSRGLHALKTPGGTGVSPGDMMHRTHRLGGESTGQFRNRGGTAQTSAFANLIQQADAACQALNSDQGQRGLAVLDAPAHANKQLRLTLSIAGTHEVGFLGGGQGRMSAAHRNQANVTGTNAGGVRVIIDRAPGAANIHVQTCFPLDALPQGSAYEVKDMGSNATIARG